MASGTDRQIRERRGRASLLAVLALLCLSLPSKADERKVQKRVQPVYPELAKRMHIGGLVRVSVTIAPDGSVTEAKALNGNKLLEQAAEDAVKKWRFVSSDAQSTVDIDINFDPSN